MQLVSTDSQLALRCSAPQQGSNFQRYIQTMHNIAACRTEPWNALTAICSIASLLQAEDLLPEELQQQDCMYLLSSNPNVTG